MVVDGGGGVCKLGLQGFEIMGIAAVGNNLITYVINEMHFSLSKSANIVTNFIGTVFILALLGGYLSDSYLGCFWTMLIFGFVELSVSIYIYIYITHTHTHTHVYISFPFPFSEFHFLSASDTHSQPTIIQNASRNSILINIIYL